MKLYLDKASGRSKCRGTSCKQDPQFISNGKIKKGTTCVTVQIDSASGWAFAYYCRDCIDQLYINMKTILNPKLWILL